MPPLQLSGGGGGGGGVLENEIGLYPTHNKMEVGSFFFIIMLHLFQMGEGGCLLYSTHKVCLTGVQTTLHQ